MTTGFLNEVASDLWRRYGPRVTECAMLFPSRRARLFFTEALASMTDVPLWQPEWLTIDDLMSEISGLRAGDRIRLITELYAVYAEFHAEPFDRFYAWGDLLLNDFDTIDKYLIDADRLFRNISDLKELEADVSYLTPAQLHILRSFWSSLLVEADLSDEKRRFLAVWRTLGEVYHRFRRRLSELGIAYTGMIQRVAVERLAAGEYTLPPERHKRFVIAGFNALSECEKRLFRFLAVQTETDFYWDYDRYYTQDRRQEAGLFIRENLRQFPPRTELTHDAFACGKQLTAVAASSDAVQCKYVAEILRDLVRRNGGRPLGKETAIVLTDENLLMPLLYALPSEVGQVNVTMGYPLRQTLASTFVERLLDLQRHRRTKGTETLFYHVDVTGLLTHPYVTESDPALVETLQAELVEHRRIAVGADLLGRNELLRRIFVPAAGWRGLSEYLETVLAEVARLPYEGNEARQRVEFLALIAEHVAKLRNSLEACTLDIPDEVYVSLLRRTLRTLRIPFEGEPLEGIQVMGILETRNLDFRNVILLSMTDDNFPGNLLTQPSFVPYNLRMAYGLPTPEHHEGVYAYYFYRLLQRAEAVWMLYCSRADDKSTGEPSRYIYQLEFESGLTLHKVEVGVDVNLAPAEPIVVPKDEAVMRRLRRFLAGARVADEPMAPKSDAAAQVGGADREVVAKEGVASTDVVVPTLSPTAFSRYVACPLRFYFYSVARIRPDEELTEEVDNPLFGTILHDAAQRLYEPLCGEAHPAERLRLLVKQGAVERVVREAIDANCLHDPDASEEDYTGNLLIVRDIVTKYLRGGVIRYDAAQDAFAVRGLETDVAYDFPFEAAGKRLAIRFAGRADRVDSLDDGALRVVDYKTGTAHLDYDGVESLFTGKGRQRLPNILQTMLYALMLHHSESRDVEPALYYVREMHREEYAPQLCDRTHEVGARYASFGAAFEEQVRQVLAEMFDPKVPFRQCDDVDTCRYCDFREICRR